MGFSSRLAVTRTLLLSLTLVLSIALAASQTLPCDTSILDNNSKMGGNRERTFIMLKPDAVQRGLVGEIIKRFEQKGFKLVAMKMMHASVEHLEEHYSDLKGKGSFPGLIKYMNSGPVVPMVWEGLNIVKNARHMLGNYDPDVALPGTIRGDFSVQAYRNICHASDSKYSAKKEAAFWFPDDELVQWDPVTMSWLYEETPVIQENGKEDLEPTAKQGSEAGPRKKRSHLLTVHSKCIFLSAMNKRWDNFQYIKLPQRSVFWRIEDTINCFQDLPTFRGQRPFRACYCCI